MAKSAICFMDFEASSLGTHGFPIEVGWSNDAGDIESHLIVPERQWLADDSWDPIAENVHGITRDQLERQGREARWVAERLNAVLAECIVMADGLPYDGTWLSKLFECTPEPQAFALEDAAHWFKSQAPADKDPWLWYQQLRLRAKRSLAGLQWHRAGNDVRRLQEMARLIQ